MVLYDDKKWLCRLIRTSFSIDDDTGICEKVLKDRPYLEGYEPDSDSAESDESFEIREGAEAGHRRRSNTAMRLEKLDRQRRAQTETHVVRLNPDEPIKNHLCFERDTGFRERKGEGEMSKNVFSTACLLESVASPDTLPFRKYTRFEASSQPASISKTMAIFLTFLDPARRAYPLHVSVTVTAKIIDLIGLILWMTSQTYPGVELFSPNHYNLQIADEDGEWDPEFPALDHNESLSKFSFSHMALVKCENAQRNESLRLITLSFLLPNRSTYRLKTDNPDIPMGQLITLLLDESAWTQKRVSAEGRTAIGYHLEKLGEPKTKFADPTLPLSLAKCKEFCLVRDGAKSAQDIPSTSSQPSTSTTDANRRVATDMSTGGRPDLMFSCMIPVTVSVGRFNKLKNAMCVIWSGDRMDLEFQHKVKSYPLSLINGVKYDGIKNRIMLSLLQPAGTGVVGSHYLSTTTQLTFLTSEPRLAVELYQHFNLILTNRK